MSGEQGDAEAGPLAEDAFDDDFAADFAHDPVADRKAQPGAYPNRLGGEERIENPGQDLGRNTDAGVPDLDGDPPVTVEPRGEPDLVVDSAALGDGLCGVDDKVHEHLAEARLVAHHWRD